MATIPKRKRNYTHADLWPPGSQGNVDFPPAAFYPVYLGNFLCPHAGQLVPRVQQYFASKGLLARMVFVRDAANDPFREYQDRTNLYDCLVYFTRPEDAEDAVRYLHREKYFGHRLNIFPGRFPVFFDPSKSVKYTIMNRSVSITEQVLEKMLTAKEPSGRVICAVKHSMREIFVEFSDRAGMELTLQQYELYLPERVPPNQPMQRFLEQHAITEMRFHMTANPMFMFLMPAQDILDALFTGVQPNIVEDWHENRVPTVKNTKLSRRQSRLYKARSVARATKQNFGLECVFADGLRPEVGTLVQRAIRKVGKKAAKKNMSMAEWNMRYPQAEEVYTNVAAGSPRDPIPYRRYRTPDDRDPYTYDDLYNVGLRYIQGQRYKHSRY